MPPRIALPALLSVALLTAGCVGGPVAGPSDTPTPTESPTSTETPTSTPFPSGTTALPHGPKDAPERPATLTESSVREYVRTYEYRYAYNALWYNQHSDVNVECEVTALVERASGYAAKVRCYGYSNTRGPADGNETATELHADWGTRTYSYHVDSDTARRLDYDAVDSPNEVPSED